MITTKTFCTMPKILSNLLGNPASKNYVYKSKKNSIIFITKSQEESLVTILKKYVLCLGRIFVYKGKQDEGNTHFTNTLRG